MLRPLLSEKPRAGCRNKFIQLLILRQQNRFQLEYFLLMMDVAKQETFKSFTVSNKTRFHSLNFTNLFPSGKNRL